MFTRWIQMTVMAALLGGIASTSSIASATPMQDDVKAELEKKKAALPDGDADATFELALWAQANGLNTDHKRLLRQVIKIDRDHADARKLLGYQMYNDKWVTAREKERLEKKAEEAKMEAQGLRKWQGEWYPAEEVEKFEQGLFKVDVQGEMVWMTAIEKDRFEQGLVPYKGQWIKAEDKEKIDQGLFPFEGEWLSKEEADKVHAELGKHWELESQYCNFASTCNYDFIQKAMEDADKVVEMAHKWTGREMPEDFAKLDIMLVNKIDDYNNIGNIAQETDDALMSSCWGAFSAPNPETGRSVGVTMYTVLDANNPDSNDNFSRFLVRHAAAEVALRSMNWQEEVPRWFITGMATYAERYWDPWHGNGWKQLGSWSANALQGSGGMMKLGQFFEPFTISRQAVLQSGLLFSYLVHGQGKPASVEKAWAEVQAAMGSEDQKGLNKAFIKLESALSKDGEDELKKYQEFLSSGG